MNNPIIKLELRKDSRGEHILAVFRQRMNGKCRYYDLTFASTIRLINTVGVYGDNWQVHAIDSASLWLEHYPKLRYAP